MITRLHRLLGLAVGFSTAALFAPAAQAGYPIKPYDATIVATRNPTFLVYRDRDESLAEVEVSSSPDATSYGFVSGYVGSCYPTTPFSEADKYTCQLVWPLAEGTYYWQYSYSKYGCRDVTYGSYTYRSCGYRTVRGPVWSFTVQLPAKPVEAPLPAISAATAVSHIAPPYSEIASKLSGKSAIVNCWSRSDWNALHTQWTAYEGSRGVETGGLSNVLGYVRPDRSDVANLAPDVCARLDLLLYRKKRPKAPSSMFDIARAVVTLAHEAIHVYGVQDEAVTECYALQLTQSSAVLLGTTASYGRTLANLLWAKDWPRWEGTEYWTADCYDGGPLDLNPNSAIWP